MRDKTRPPYIESGEYKHFKGDTYEVTGVALDASDGQEDRWMVCYRKLGETAALFVRDADEFLGFVFIDGKNIKRFEKLTDD